MSLSTDPLSTARWRAVTLRDPTAQFFYAVHSTGIYCRPSCPARLARRAGVSFFDTLSAAESAGYRACKRCRPRDGSVEAPAQVLERVARLIEDAAGRGEEFTLVELARRAGCTASHLCRSFKKGMGVTPKGYARMVRRDEKREEVEEKDVMFDFADFIDFEPDLLREDECLDMGSLFSWEVMVGD